MDELLSKRSKNEIEMFECILVLSVYFVLSIDILNIIFGFCVFFCIYEIGKCDFSKNKKPDVWAILVRNILGGIVGPAWSPYVAEASLGSILSVLQNDLEFNIKWYNYYSKTILRWRQHDPKTMPTWSWNDAERIVK